MASKLQDAAQSVKAASKEVDKLRSETASLERDHTQMTARNTALATKTAKAEAKLKHLEKQVIAAEEALLRLHHDTTALEAKNDQLETDRAEKALQLSDIHTELNSRKTTVDRELEAYSLKRKQEIKADILSVHAELEAPRLELTTITEQIANKNDELRMLNTTLIAEQNEAKVTHELIDQDLVDKQVLQTELAEKIEETKQSLQKLLYERDNALMTIKKAQEEHQKYVEYERKSRMILDAKDKQLIEKSSEIESESQLLQNKRSFLSPL